MQTVKVQRRGISQEQAATAIGEALGGQYKVDFAGDALEVSKNSFTRAKVEMRDEPDGTVFEVKGLGIPAPLLFWTLKLINDKGIATKTAEAISQTDAFRASGS
jgi:hypothetical protein